MKEITVILKCKCSVVINYETENDDPNGFSAEEEQEIFEKALSAYNPALEYDYELDYIEDVE